MKKLACTAAILGIVLTGLVAAPASAYSCDEARPGTGKKLCIM